MMGKPVLGPRAAVNVRDEMKSDVSMSCSYDQSQLLLYYKIVFNIINLISMSKYSEPHIKLE